MHTFLVTWVIPKTKFYKDRKHGKEYIDAGCADEATLQCQLLLAKRFILHAAMVKVYRVKVVSVDMKVVA